MGYDWSTFTDTNEEVRLIEAKITIYEFRYKNRYVSIKSSELLITLKGVMYAAPLFGWLFQPAMISQWWLIGSAFIVFIFRYLIRVAKRNEVTVQGYAFSDLREDTPVYRWLRHELRFDLEAAFRSIVAAFPNAVFVLQYICINDRPTELLSVYYIEQEDLQVFDAPVLEALQRRYT